MMARIPVDVLPRVSEEVVVLAVRPGRVTGSPDTTVRPGRAVTVWLTDGEHAHLAYCTTPADSGSPAAAARGPRR
jgi:hypothetical protein